jgi:hypothetical protein
MNHVLYLIDSAGLDSPDKIARAAKEWPLKRIGEIRDQLWEILQTGSTSALNKTDGSDPFDFVASSSMRGEDGCFAWECRIQKARTLTRYGALYARRILIPIRVGVSPIDHETEYNLRYGLAGTLMSILEYRPLIESGSAILSAGALCYCREHLDEAVPSHPKIDSIAKSLFAQQFKKFSVTTDGERGANGSPMLLVKGPEDYIPHGKLWLGDFSGPSTIPRRARGTRKVRSIPQVTPDVRKRAVERLFHKIAYDVTIQQYFTMSTSATCLTDMPGEAQVLNLLNAKDENDVRNALFAKHLLHTVPLLNEVPIDTVMKLRKEEPDAFLQYRAAIAKIIREYANDKTTLSEKDAKNISRDILEPELARLRTQANTIRRAGIRKVTAKAIASFVAVGLGAYGGLLPSDLASLLTAAGGVSLLSQIGEAVGLIEKSPGEIKNQNLYFLLKLQSGSRRKA